MMRDLILRCYEEYVERYTRFFNEVPSVFNSEFETTVPKVDENGNWFPEDACYVKLSDTNEMYPDLFELFKEVRYYPMNIIRKNFLIQLEGLIEKRNNKTGELSFDYFFSIVEKDELYFVLGYAESETDDFTVVLKNKDGSIWLLSKTELFPFYENLRQFLGDYHE